jgi:hypothetical protein
MPRRVRIDCILATVAVFASVTASLAAAPDTTTSVPVLKPGVKTQLNPQPLPPADLPAATLTTRGGVLPTVQERPSAPSPPPDPDPGGPRVPDPVPKPSAPSGG